ncbi:MAG: hypothetical protein HC845_13160 [Akkermansiaceae bacterium]|nr:hypothetical protein [Akkermansiaceae bacterium]
MIRFIVCLICISIQAIAGDCPWPGVKFTEVRAFAWPSDKEAEAVVLDGMEPKTGAINPGGAVLTKEQTLTVIRAVSGERPSYTVASCHIPHNALIFYDAAKKPVAYIEICFGCSNHRISPKGTARFIDLVAIASVFEAHKLPMGEYKDFATYKQHFGQALKASKEDEDAK